MEQVQQAKNLIISVLEPFDIIKRISILQLVEMTDQLELYKK